MSRNLIALAIVLAALGAGCGGHDHNGHGHEHIPPHGGTPVILGNEDYHLEFVHDPEAGQKMHAYILDGHMDRFIRIPAESFEVQAQLPDREEVLVFRPVANPATGETIGDTAQFTAEAEWLKGGVEFDAVLKTITIRGREYSAVKFNFPKGH